MQVTEFSEKKKVYNILVFKIKQNKKIALIHLNKAKRTHL